MNNINYRFLNHIDAPRRYLSLTADELAIAILGFALLVASNQKILAALLSLSLLTGLRRLKKGAAPKILLVLAYWYLPNMFTQFFLPQLPPSYQRIWMA